MKNFLFSLCVMAVLPVIVNAQTATFSVIADTVNVNYGVTSPTDNITNTTASGGLTIKWHVIGCNFPIQWLNASAFGICDNNVCRYNTGDTMLWNAGTHAGTTYSSAPYSYGIASLFELSLNLFGTPGGTYYATVALTDTVSSYTKNITFMITRSATNVPIVSPVEDVLLYPNPARDEVNLVFGASSDVKNVTVYNIIGKVMSVYKVNGDSANLNLESMPSGIYFVRVMDSHGAVVATRKFTKQ